MPSLSENEWDIVEPNIMDSSDSITTAAAAAATAPATAPSAPEAKSTVELTVNIKAKPDEKKDETNDKRECTCGANDKAPPLPTPALFPCDPREFRVPPPPPPPPPGGAIKVIPPPPPLLSSLRNSTAVLIKSSSDLLNKVSQHDGIVDLPFPAGCNTSLYLSTFPFSDKDVKKWSWLFSLGIQDEYLAPSGGGSSGGGRLEAVDYSSSSSDNENEGVVAFPYVRVVQNGRRDGYLPYVAEANSIPSVFLSRALDEHVVPGDADNVRYLIVMQNPSYSGGSKLLVAESRKAAGMLMYYELLKGESVVFVGAVHRGKMGVHPRKFKRVETLEEAVEMQKQGFVGVVC